MTFLIEFEPVIMKLGDFSDWIWTSNYEVTVTFLIEFEPVIMKLGDFSEGQLNVNGL